MTGDGTNGTAVANSSNETVVGLFGEPVQAASDRYHKAVLLLCVFTALVAMGFKYLQRRKNTIRSTNAEIKQLQDYIDQMVVAFEDEFAVLGVTGVLLMFGRQNYFTGQALEFICKQFGANREQIADVIDEINLAIFLIMFYFIFLHSILMRYAYRQLRNWEKEEQQCVQRNSDCLGSGTEYERLRHAFLNPVAPGAGIQRSPLQVFKHQIDFSKYLEAAMTAFIKEMVYLPLYAFVLPFLFAMVLYPCWTFLTQGTQDANHVGNLYLAALVTWLLFLVALLMDLSVRSIYKGILPPSIGVPAPMYSNTFKKHPTTMDIPDTRPDHYQALAQEVHVAPVDPEQYVSEATSDQEVRNDTSATEILSSDQEVRQVTSVPAVGDPVKSTVYRTASSSSCGCCENPRLNAQQRLFWGGDRGALFLTRLFQQLIFFCAVVPVAYELLFSWKLKYDYPVLFAVYCLPGPLIVLIFIDTLKRAVACMRLELLVDPTLIEDVCRETREVRYAMTDTARTTDRLIRQIKYETVRHKYSKLRQDGEIRQALDTVRRHHSAQPLGQIEQTYAKGVFYRYDTNDRGYLDARALMSWLDGEGFGATLDPERTVSEWIHIFDYNKDGQVDLEEFLVLHRCLLHEVRVAKVTLEACEWICANLDKDRNNVLDPNEFAAALSVWMHVPVKAGDVAGIWTQIQPIALQKGYIQIPAVAEWLYEMVQTHGDAQELERQALQKLKTKHNIDYHKEASVNATFGRRGSGWDLNIA